MTDRLWKIGRWDKLETGQWVRLVGDNGEVHEFQLTRHVFNGADSDYVASERNSFVRTSGWALLVEIPPLALPTEPGTVIAIGGWWLTRLRPYEGASSGWELHPMPTKHATEKVKSMGIATQCVYDDAWVLAEAEQEGGFVVISKPVTA